MYSHNYHPNYVIFPQNWYIGKMTPLSQTNSSVQHINEVTHDINPDTVSTSWTQQSIDPCTKCNMQNKPQPKIKMSVIMPSDIQVHRQVNLNNANISKETKLALQKLLQKLNSIISKSDNDIGQMDLIEMHIAKRPHSSPVAARPYPLALKHHNFLKQGNTKFIRHWNHPQKHVHLGKPYHSCQKNTPLRVLQNGSNYALIKESKIPYYLL